MKNIVAVAHSSHGQAHVQMALEALGQTAKAMGHHVETQAGETQLADGAIADADVIIVASDENFDLARFAGKPLYQTPTAQAIRHTRQTIESALELLPADAVMSAANGAHNGAPAKAKAPDIATQVTPPVAATPPTARADAPVETGVAGKKLVGITSCPTGIAHTFMAAEALQKAAKKLGHSIKVETQGSVGSQNTLTPAEIAEADAVVIAADTKVDLSRFAGKRLLSTSTKDAMHHGPEVIERSLNQPVEAANAGSLAARVESEKAARSSERTGPYKHLMTGVSYMLPLLVAGGLCIALAFAIGGIDAGKQQGTLAAALNQIGGGTAFGLFVAILSAFIAFSIADRPGIAPGLVGGMLAQSQGAGFLGGIVAGFLAGYLTLWLAKTIKLPANLEGLKPVLILPFLSTVIVGLAMIFVIAPPVGVVLDATTAWLNAMRGTNAILLGLLLGGMMAFDMGGPINKAAYTFSVGLLASNVYTPMAAVIVGGMVPPLGLALAATLFPDRFDEDERKARGAAFVLGLAFITEGAIPFAAKDPVRVIPALVAGAAVAGAISTAAGIGSLVPHGGVFAAIIPGAVTGLPMFAVAVLVGTLVTTGGLWILKRPLPQDEIEAAPLATNS